MLGKELGINVILKLSQKAHVLVGSFSPLLTTSKLPNLLK